MSAAPSFRRQFPVDDARTIELARTLASTPSQSGAEREAVEVMVAAMAGIGMRACIDASGNAVGRLGRGEPGAPRLLIDGHIDTIPLHSAESWTVDPFGAVIRDDKLFGLGICDQKASLASAVGGIGAVAERLAGAPGLVALVASVNEEDMEGAALAGALDEVEPTVVITTEPSDARLMVGQRGRAKLELEVVGRACHAGHAAQGLNAAEALAEVIAAVRQLPTVHHAQLGRRDVTCIDVHSLPYPSVSTVPGRAVARFDCRFPPGDTEHSLVALLEETARQALAEWPEAPRLSVRVAPAAVQTFTGRVVELSEYAAPWWTEGPIVAGAQHALGAVGLDPTTSHYSFCTNGSLSAGSRGITTLGFGAGEEHMAHQVDEYVTLGSVLAVAQGLASLALELTGS